MRQARLTFIVALVGTAAACALLHLARAGDVKTSDTEESGGIIRADPHHSGETDSAFWGHLTETQETDAVDKLKSFAQDAANKLTRTLHPDESKFFLLYSDLPQIESTRDLALLEKMYGKLAELFGLNKGQNVWRGKSLVFIFLRREDYDVYERLVEKENPAESFAMTHCFGDGMVHTAFFRYPDEAQFEHLLAHEAVHGFLHRYKSPRRIPSWANEGLADEAAAEVVPDRRRQKLILGLARAGLDKRQNAIGDFFTAPHIDGWQYPVAECLSAWMIRQNRDGYLGFINGIKDGQAWDESLKKNFKTPPDKMMAEFEKSLKANDVKK